MESSTAADPSSQPPEEWVAQLCAEIPADLSVSSQVRQGRPAAEVLAYARSIQAGLIAVGHRGVAGIRELWLGSVSSVIARYAPCSVLITRGTETGDHHEPTLAHVLLVVNETMVAQSAIAVTRQLLPAGIQTITILCVQSPLSPNYLFGPFAAPTPSWQLHQSLQQAQREQGEQVLHHAIAALHAPNLLIESLLQVGEPGPLICQIAQQRHVDLIILGSSGARQSLLAPLQSLRKHRQVAESTDASRSALRNTRLGSTEDYTIHHAPCPVLLCRGG
jgi:nucleotide-binding universal stress UspA family protein